MVEVKREESESVTQHNSSLVQRIKEIKTAHPFWGYRRTWSQLLFVDKLGVNKKWWGIDMTKVMVNSFGWMYIVVVLDWYTKKITGYYAGMECKASHWLEALYMSINA